MAKFRMMAAVLVAASGLTYSCAAAGSSDVRFTAELDKAEYATGDAVNIDFVLENNGEEAVYVNQRFYAMGKDSQARDRDVTVELISPEGESLPCKFTYTPGLPRTGNFKKLEKGESAKTERPRNLKGYFDIEKPGKYTVKAVYENMYGEEIGLDTVKGPIAAEPVVFEIKSPE